MNQIDSLFGLVLQELRTLPLVLWYITTSQNLRVEKCYSVMHVVTYYCVKLTIYINDMYHNPYPLCHVLTTPSYKHIVEPRLLANPIGNVCISLYTSSLESPDLTMLCHSCSYCSTIVHTELSSWVVILIYEYLCLSFCHFFPVHGKRVSEMIVLLLNLSYSGDPPMCWSALNVALSVKELTGIKLKPFWFMRWLM